MVNSADPYQTPRFAVAPRCAASDLCVQPSNGPLNTHARATYLETIAICHIKTTINKVLKPYKIEKIKKNPKLYSINFIPTIN